MTKQNGDGYGLSLDYQDIGGSGIGVAAAFSDSNRTSAQKRCSTVKATAPPHGPLR